MTEDHTTVKLARALAEVPGMPPDMLRKAIDGHYHDYLSPLATPDVQLVADLRELANLPTTGPRATEMLVSLAGRVINGEFDATREESDAWAASQDGQETFRLLSDSLGKQNREKR